MAAPWSAAVGLFVRLDEFQVCLTNPAIGDVFRRIAKTGRIARVNLTEDRAIAIRLQLATTDGEEVHSRKPRAVVFHNINNRQKGRHQVDTTDRRFPGRGGNHAIPANQDRSAEAVIERSSFAANSVYEFFRLFSRQTPIWSPSVVRHEDENGVPQLALFTDILDQLADGLIELSNGGEVREFVIFDTRAAPSQIVEAFWRIVRLMRKIRCIPHKPGSF